MENIETLINAISLNHSDFMLINAAEDRILHVTSRVMRLTGLKAGYNSFAAAKAALKIIQKKDLYSIAAYRKAVHSNSFILRDVKPIDYCYTCTYNIMINKQALTVGHKGFLLSLTEEGTPKLVLYVFTPSPFEKSGSCFFYNFKTRERIHHFFLMQKSSSRLRKRRIFLITFSYLLRYLYLSNRSGWSTMV